MQPDSAREKSRLMFAKAALGEELRIEAASFDASFRSYWRVTDSKGATHIVMDAPTDREDCRPFIDICQRLHAADLIVPQVLAQDLTQGFLLLPDLGVQTLLPELTAASVERHYQNAMASILRMQSAVQTVGMQTFDAKRLYSEMALLPEWFITKHLGYQLSPAEDARMKQVFDALINEAHSQPQVFVHRDFHSRNLMLANELNPTHQRLSIIDFQDALIGPITYDLVSLLKDCYIHWPGSDVARWLKHFHAQSPHLQQVSFQQLAHWFDWMGIQRHLKVLGIFARLNYRDGKARYLQDLPLVLDYTLEACARYQALQPFGAWLAERTRGVDLTKARQFT
jgi:N-acetylmuramate 1-kinase